MPVLTEGHSACAHRIRRKRPGVTYPTAVGAAKVERDVPIALAEAR